MFFRLACMVVVFAFAYGCGIGLLILCAAIRAGLVYYGVI